MNERIKELMGKTLDDKFASTWDTMSYEGLLMFSEKFAELIVLETLDQVNKNMELTWVDGEVKIKQHFGVK